MKRIIIFCVLIITLILPVEAKVLEGSVTYEANKAWETAMSYAEKTIPQEIIDSHLIDPDYEENQVAIKYKISQLGEKRIAFYSDGYYLIEYLNNSSYGYSYDPEGNLVRISKYVETSSFKLIYFYTIENVLVAVAYQPNNYEAYAFDAKTGKMFSYWKGHTGYYTDGTVIKKRIN